MRKYKNLHRWIAVVVVLLGGCLISSALAYPQPNQPNAWRTTPTMSHDALPTYQFQSTSAYTPIVGQTNYTSTISCPGAVAPQSGPRKSSPWDKPTGGQEVGVIDTPVGDPLILLLIAALYLSYLWYRKRKSVITHKNEL